MSVATPAGSPSASCAAAGLPPRMSWPDAWSAAFSLPRPLVAVQRPLGRCDGLVLSDPVRALFALPPHASAAMDGWVVAGPPPWLVVGRQMAGDPTVTPLEHGTALVIATGARVPVGADAVLRREDGRVRSGLLHPRGVEPPPAGRHIRAAGEEACRGDVLLPAGTRLSPPAVGLAAAAGYDVLKVQRPAVVQSFVLGNELVVTGRPHDGCVRDALGPQLPGWLGALGAAGRPTQRLPDRLDVLVEALSAPSLASGTPTGPDVIITTGGSSHGPVDHVRDAVRRAGGRLLIDGVDVRPGRPMFLALLRGETWLVALPGNPLAACVALLTLVQPLLYRLHGLAAPRTGWARLAVEARGPRTGHQLLPARRSGDTVHQLPHAGSAMLRGLALADTVLVLPPGGAGVGDVVPTLPLPWCPHSPTAPPDARDDERTSS